MAWWNWIWENVEWIVTPSFILGVIITFYKWWWKPKMDNRKKHALELANTILKRMNDFYLPSDYFEKSDFNIHDTMGVVSLCLLLSGWKS